MNKRCLSCYGILESNEVDFHRRCSRKFFGQDHVPHWNWDEKGIESQAIEHVSRKWAVPGVQPKLSVSWNKRLEANPRMTIIGMLGGYILKLPAKDFPFLPEVEDLTMHLARIARIDVVPHTLIRMGNGDLAYLTKRIDRVGPQKLAMEDMCQLSGRLTEDKYKGSVEQIAKIILRFSANPGLDVVNFFEQVLFAYLTGNADMHLKNYSLIEYPERGYVLSPAYDLVATHLVNPQDDEETALPLNGKKKRLRKNDFTNVFGAFGLDAKQQTNLFAKFEGVLSQWNDQIQQSFLSAEMKQAYIDLVAIRWKTIS